MDTRVCDWPYSRFHRYVKNACYRSTGVAIWRRSRVASRSNRSERQPPAQNRPDPYQVMATRKAIFPTLWSC